MSDRVDSLGPIPLCWLPLPARAGSLTARAHMLRSVQQARPKALPSCTRGWPQSPRRVSPTTAVVLLAVVVAQGGLPLVLQAHAQSAVRSGRPLTSEAPQAGPRVQYQRRSRPAKASSPAMSRTICGHNPGDHCNAATLMPVVVCLELSVGVSPPTRVVPPLVWPTLPARASWPTCLLSASCKHRLQAGWVNGPMLRVQRIQSMWMQYFVLVCRALRSTLIGAGPPLVTVCSAVSQWHLGDGTWF